MEAHRWQNLVEMFFDQAVKYKKKPFLWAKHDGKFDSQSWEEVARNVASLAQILRNQGIRAGDRVALVSENRPEWLIADLAIMAAGGITVPAYTTYTARDHLHILENSGAKGAILSTAKLAKEFLPAAHQSDPLRFVIAMEPPKIAQSVNADIYQWDDLMAEVDDGNLDEAAEIATTLASDQTACLIYTSGTGGAPKGVMIHHGGILHNCRAAQKVLEEIGLKNNVFLSFLPLSHAYEHTAGQFLPISIGAQIYYAEGLDKLAKNIEEARPTVMVVVPRLFEMLRNRITRAIEKDGGLRKTMFYRLVELGTRQFRDPGSLDPMERVQLSTLDRIVGVKVRKKFGGRIKALVSGGAPLNPEVGEFFHALGLPLLQGYGQTESSPVVSVNPPSRPKVHTVGPPLDGVAVRIAKDGEILIRGDLVMKGYWNDEDASKRVLVDGWLHTGDVGLIDADGHIQITDRKKDIIVNDKGDNVSPARVEGMLTLEPEIGQVMVYGDQRPYLVALVVPDLEWLNGWKAQTGKSGSLSELRDDADLIRAIDAAVTRVNGRLSTVERVRRIRIAPEAFSIENEQITPTMKVRRHVVSRAYGKELASLYTPR